METDEAEDVMGMASDFACLHEVEWAVDERMVESLSIEDNSTLASSVPLYNSVASSLRSDGLCGVEGAP